MEQALIELEHDTPVEDDFELDIRVSAPSSDIQPVALATANTCYKSCGTTCLCVNEEG